MRLIDADATYKMAKDDKRYPAFHYHKANLGDLYYLVLVDSPTIEAEPVRHGEWKNEVELYPDRYGWVPFDSVVCSCCNKSNSVETSYCPSCGAKMDGAPK